MAPRFRKTWFPITARDATTAWTLRMHPSPTRAEGRTHAEGWATVAKPIPRARAWSVNARRVVVAMAHTARWVAARPRRSSTQITGRPRIDVPTRERSRFSAKWVIS